MFNNKNRKESALYQKEKHLAFCLLVPTVFLILSIIIFPLFANFWISFKPISQTASFAPYFWAYDVKVQIVLEAGES